MNCIVGWILIPKYSVPTPSLWYTHHRRDVKQKQSSQHRERRPCKIMDTMQNTCESGSIILDQTPEDWRSKSWRPPTPGFAGITPPYSTFSHIRTFATCHFNWRTSFKKISNNPKGYPLEEFPERRSPKGVLGGNRVLVVQKTWGKRCTGENKSMRVEKKRT